MTFSANSQQQLSNAADILCHEEKVLAGDEWRAQVFWQRSVRQDSAGLLSVLCSVLFQLDNLGDRREDNGKTHCRQVERQSVRQTDGQCYIPNNTDSSRKSPQREPLIAVGFK